MIGSALGLSNEWSELVPESWLANRLARGSCPLGGPVQAFVDPWRARGFGYNETEEDTTGRVSLCSFSEQWRDRIYADKTHKLQNHRKDLYCLQSKDATKQPVTGESSFEELLKLQNETLNRVLTACNTGLRVWPTC